jgi:glycerol kinase
MLAKTVETAKSNNMEKTSQESIRFSVLDRCKQLKKLSSETFDLIIIGGGVTGAGIALDAASRGLNVCLN